MPGGCNWAGELSQLCGLDLPVGEVRTLMLAPVAAVAEILPAVAAGVRLIARVHALVPLEIAGAAEHPVAVVTIVAVNVNGPVWDPVLKCVCWLSAHMGEVLGLETGRRGGDSITLIMVKGVFDEVAVGKEWSEAHIFCPAAAAYDLSVRRFFFGFPLPSTMPPLAIPCICSRGGQGVARQAEGDG